MRPTDKDHTEKKGFNSSYIVQEINSPFDFTGPDHAFKVFTLQRERIKSLKEENEIYRKEITRAFEEREAAEKKFAQALKDLQKERKVIEQIRGILSRDALEALIAATKRDFAPFTYHQL